MPALLEAGRSADPLSRPISRLGSQSGLPADDELISKEATLPLCVDTVIRTKWLDGEYHLARVVSMRDKPGAKDSADKEYYMHYVNMNRRMDTWVTADVMDLSWHEIDSIDEKRCAFARPTASCMGSHCYLLICKAPACAQAADQPANWVLGCMAVAHICRIAYLCAVAYRSENTKTTMAQSTATLTWQRSASTKSSQR